jgi:hypothetical protein
MYAYFKTEDELLNSGWAWSYDELRHPSNGGITIPREMLRDMAGNRYSLPDGWDGGPVNLPNWTVTPEMFRVARVKTEAELFASGWGIVSDGFGHPDIHIRMTPTHIRYLGKYIPVRRRPLGDGTRSSYADVIWIDSMLIGAAQENQRNTRERIKAFRDADLPTALASITAGFELETQRSDDQTWNRMSDGERELNYPVALQFIRDMWVSDSHLADDLVGCCRCQFDSTAPAFRDRATLASRFPDYDSFRNAILNEEMEREFIEHLFDQHGGFVHYVQLPSNTWISSTGDPRTYFHEKFGLPSSVQTGSDGSVSGFEFRTVGGLTRDSFEEAARALFKVPHLIDEACSFHTHIKVPGIQHRWGERMQQALTEYLIENIDEAPATVRQRWATIRNRSHIQPGISIEKYSFIHAHPQGTWEFRCFGNVRTAEDGMKCLELAVRALQHAYRVVTGQVSLFSDQHGLSNEDWRRLCVEALTQGQTLTARLEANPDQYPTAA